MMTADFGLLVNSTDSFEDCWIPFFSLLSRHWARPLPRVTLNTEFKDFSFPDISVSSSKVARRISPRASWSECLIHCLQQVSDDIILYMQEDYFISGPVNVQFLSQVASYMRTYDIAHVMLVPARYRSPHLLWTVDDRLIEMRRHETYRVSCQAGFWRKNELLKLLIPGESAWDFERWGNVRSFRLRQRFLACNPRRFASASNYPVPYTPTGIVRGKWYAPAVCDLFATNQIFLDFSERGFAPELTGRRGAAIAVRAQARRLTMSMLASAQMCGATSALLRRLSAHRS